jgi:DNA-binding MarR family transcriptional regulator
MIREELRLDNQLCFKVHRLSRLFVSMYQPLLGLLGITYPQYTVMLVLWERQSVDYQELAGLLGYSTGTLTPLIERLEQMRVIRREKNETDRRRTNVVLLPAGREMAARVEAAVGRIGEAGIAFDPDRLKGYAETIDSLTAELIEAEQKLTGSETIDNEKK